MVKIVSSFTKLDFMTHVGLCSHQLKDNLEQQRLENDFLQKYLYWTNIILLISKSNYMF